MAERILCVDTRSSSALVVWAMLLAIVWYACVFCHIGLHATTADISFYMIGQRCWKTYHWQSEHECGTPIMTNGDVEGAPRSPHLDPLDLYLWGHLQTLVYATPHDNEQSLHHSIVDACQTICNYPGISDRMRRSMLRLVGACIEFHGGSFENYFYKCTISATYNSQIKCFWTHVDTNIFSCFVMWNSCPNFPAPCCCTLKKCIDFVSPILQYVSTEEIQLTCIGNEVASIRDKKMTF
jgi:hypothetical protein